MPEPSNGNHIRGPIPQTLERFALGAAALSLILIAILSYRDAASFSRLSDQVDSSQSLVESSSDLVSSLTDAETGQRGFLLTDRESYLDPYNSAVADVPRILTNLENLTAGQQDQAARAETVKHLAQEKLDELQATINLRRSQGPDAALALVRSDRGKLVMDQIRQVSGEIEMAARGRLARQTAAARSTANRTRLIVIGGSLLIFALLISATITVQRGTRRRLALIKELQASQAAHALLASIVESSEDAIYSKTSADIVTSWNQGAENLFGYSAAEMIGQPLSRLMPSDVDDDEPAILARIQRGESIDHYETVRVTKDGSRIHVSLTVSPLKDQDGRIVGASKIARDITERKLASQKLQAQVERLALLDHITRAVGERQDLRSIFQVVIRSLEDSMPIAFACVCLYDPAAFELTVTCVGVRSGALAMQLAMTESAHIGIDQNGLARSVEGQLVYEPDLAVVDFPFPRRLLEGGLRSVVMAPLLVESKVFGILVAARSEPNAFTSGDCEFLRQLSGHVALAAHHAELYGSLQRAYDDLRQTQQAVIQQERLRALGQMASGIAHDINNALSPVALYTESLLDREHDLSAPVREYLEMMQRALDDVAHTVARMHEFYRQREPQLILKPVDLNLMLQQVLNLTRARWNDMPQQRGVVINIGTEFAPDLPKVPGNESEIREALVNLIFNAVDAMPHGGTLRLRTAAPGADSPARLFPHVVVEVSDTGYGMDEETRRRCLEPFFSTKGERGTGLGLAMVFGMTQRHHGEIEIESARGVGTTIRLLFPLRHAEPARSASEESNVRPPRMRILLVDDDPLILRSLCETLENDGHLVTTAVGGKEGIEAFQSAPADAPFAVVITDLGMPRIDGRQVAAAVKASRPATAVILLTGWGQRLLSEGDTPSQVDRVLSKPPKLRELRTVLNELAVENS